MINDHPYSYLLHPVKRNINDEARALIRSFMWKTCCRRGGSASSHLFRSVRSAKDIHGTAVVIRNGNTLELVAPLAHGGWGHWKRTCGKKGSQWHGPVRYGSRKWDAVSMIRSRNGHLAFIVRRKDRLFHVYGRGRRKLRWYISPPFAEGVRDTPLLAENRNGNFEVIATLKNGGIGHWWGNHRHSRKMWYGPTVICKEKVKVVSLIITNDRKLVAVVEKDGRLVSYIQSDNGHWKMNTND
jgi:hypothetical protein